jgi:hypothetical protein
MRLTEMFTILDSMAHTSNLKWWLADLVVEFVVGEKGANLVHYNLTLVRAESAEQAYDKAVEFGNRHDTAYMNTDGQPVISKFRGLRELTMVYDELEDGAELRYEEQSDVPEPQIVAVIKPKEKLAAFAPG